MIAGYSGGPDHGHAVVWRPIGQGSYSVTDLGVLPGGAYSYARTITDESVVAGESYLSETDIHAVVWRPSGQGSYSITDLGALPGSLSSSAYGVNAGGRDRRLLRLPGAARSDPPRRHLDPDGGGLLCDQRAARPARRQRQSAYAVNGAGVAAGDAFSSNRQQHALVWIGSQA